jgi:hypothetical protein
VTSFIRSKWHALSGQKIRVEKAHTRPKIFDSVGMRLRLLRHGENLLLLIVPGSWRTKASIVTEQFEPFDCTICHS